MYISLVSNLSLSEYVKAMNAHCSSMHPLSCKKCEYLTGVANIILQENFCHISETFKMVSPDTKYTAMIARRVLLQLPLVSIRVGKPSNGNSFTVLMEKFQGMDYSKLASIVNSPTESEIKEVSLQKSTIKMILSIAKSDSERKNIRYCIYKSSGMTPSQIRQQYGFEGMHERALSVEATISNVQQIRESIQDLAAIEEQALLTNFSVPEVYCVTSSSEEEECIMSQKGSSSQLSSVRETENADSASLECNILDIDNNYLKLVLYKSKYNWFEILDQLEEHLKKDVSTESRTIFSAFSRLDLRPEELEVLEQSYFAYLALCGDLYPQYRDTRSINGEIICDVESDDPNSYIGLKDTLSEKGKALISKKRAAIHIRMKRKQLQLVEEKRLPKRVSKILQECPEIGNEIESFVQSHNVGADAWRRTGVLTFDGNLHRKEKVTTNSSAS